MGRQHKTNTKLKKILRETVFKKTAKNKNRIGKRQQRKARTVTTNLKKMNLQMNLKTNAQTAKLNQQFGATQRRKDKGKKKGSTNETPLLRTTVDVNATADGLSRL